MGGLLSCLCSNCLQQDCLLGFRECMSLRGPGFSSSRIEHSLHKTGSEAGKPFTKLPGRFLLRGFADHLLDVIPCFCIY